MVGLDALHDTYRALLNGLVQGCYSFFDPSIFPENHMTREYTHGLHEMLHTVKDFPDCRRLDNVVGCASQLLCNGTRPPVVLGIVSYIIFY